MDKVCIIISLALMLTVCTATRKAFPQIDQHTWESARNTCQVCYEDLVTLTPENIQTLSLDASSDYWIGLRKYFPSKSSLPWSRWANGDPLAFQNWYPGWPLKKPAPPKEECCSCSCMCPAWGELEANFTTPNYNLSGCVHSPAVPPTPGYIEDSCVAMLSSRAWVERKCSDPLPFICYEDHFVGEVTVTDITSVSASLSWLQAPGSLSSYHLKVNGNLVDKLSSTTFDLTHLTGGTFHSVQVFPVKCEEEHDPQETAFFTLPNKVVKLTVEGVTETSILLTWVKPDGGVDFYCVHYEGLDIRRDTENARLDLLTPGNGYTFTVLSAVNKTKLSEGSSVEAFTKPGKVSNLKVSENNETFLRLTWEPPAGNTSGYRVTATSGTNPHLYNKVVEDTEVTVDGLPAGTRINLMVRALANGTLEGKPMSIINYTVPGRIFKLQLIPTHESLKATWTPPEGEYSHFNVTIKHEDTEQSFEVTERQKLFRGLMAAGRYTVTIFAVSGGLAGSSVEGIQFTLPQPPTDPKANFSGEETLSFTWSPPLNSASVMYNVKLSSAFWGQSFNFSTHDTFYTFTGLKSGSKYDFEVRAEAGGRTSDPAKASHSTVAAIREISLSALCSSAKSLFCDKESTRENVFNKLKEHFRSHFGDKIFWELERQKSEN